MKELPANDHKVLLEFFSTMTYVSAVLNWVRPPQITLEPVRIPFVNICWDPHLDKSSQLYLDSHSYRSIQKTGKRSQNNERWNTAATRIIKKATKKKKQQNKQTNKQTYKKTKNANLVSNIFGYLFTDSHSTVWGLDRWHLGVTSVTKGKNLPFGQLEHRFASFTLQPITTRSS